MKKLLALVLAGMMAFSLTACGDGGSSSSEGSASDGSSAAGGEDKAVTIGVTIYKYDDNFMSYVRNDMDKIVAEMDGKVTLSMNDSQNNQSTQNDQVDTMIGSNVDALAINLVDPQAAAVVQKKAQDAEIPIVFFNKEPDLATMQEYDKSFYVGTTSSESGVEQGNVVVDYLKADADKKWDKNGDGKIQYLMMKGEPGHPDAEARTEYSVKTIKDAGYEMELLAPEDTAMWDTAKAKELMDNWYAQYGDKIELVLCNNDGMALGVVSSLTANKVNGKVMVAGVDALPEVMDYIESGDMIGTVLNDDQNQAQAVIDLAVNLARGNDPLAGTSWKFDETGKSVRVPYKAVTKENYKEFVK
ncbi:galactose ABC transporter substrate-binding protein [Candidatus Soleaferrea massiliensis]|uniref:galactose ABC transporter substrate-binding protein n=1 Tax=Candidatus Soleaferrea massiliensis TaxID=1470354 RepID=UPI00058C7D70|nr:galactose ABC transporter substrate-binding protein [Candidatus Soleaferrea massiliensis]